MSVGANDYVADPARLQKEFRHNFDKRGALVNRLKEKS
jgi:hypothetical protein